MIIIVGIATLLSLMCLNHVRERNKYKVKLGFCMLEIAYTNFFMCYALIKIDSIRLTQCIILILFPIIQIYNYLKRGQNESWDMDTILSNYRMIYMILAFILVDAIIVNKWL